MDFCDADYFQQVSLQEIATFVGFAEECPHDLASWIRFSPEQLVEMKQKQNWKSAAAFLASRPAWKDKLQKFAPDLKNKRSGFLKDMPDWMQKAWEGFYEYQFCELVEESLLRPYVAEPFKLGVQSSLGQILHVGASIAYKVFGEDWPKHVALFDGLAEEHDNRLACHRQAKLACGIVHTDWHWACFFYKLGDARVWISDGMQQNQIKDAVLSVMVHISEQPWFQLQPDPSALPEICYMLVPKQEDTWSCGHRVALSLLAVLENFKAHGEVPNAISDDQISAGGIQELVGRLHSPDQPVVSEQAPSIPEPASPPQKVRKVKAAATPEPAEIPVTPVPSRKRILAARADVGQATPDNPQDEKRQRCVSKSEKATMQEKLSKAKDMLKSVAFDHNVHFQTPHYQAKKPPARGHWNDFCISLVSSSKTSCDVCNQLLMEQWAKLSSDTKDPSPLPDADDISDDPPASFQVVAKAEPVRRGRRPKNQNSDMRDIDTWVAEERQGIYTRMNTTDTRHPFWCSLCGCRVLAQRQHDHRYFLYHESRHKHIAMSKARSLDKEAASMPVQNVALGDALVVAEESCECSGVPVNHENFNISQLSESCWNLFSHGTPAVKRMNGEKADGYGLHLHPDNQKLYIKSGLVENLVRTFSMNVVLRGLMVVCSVFI